MRSGGVGNVNRRQGEERRGEERSREEKRREEKRREEKRREETVSYTHPTVEKNRVVLGVLVLITIKKT